MWDVTEISEICPVYFPEFLLTHPVWDVTRSITVYRRTWRFLLTHPVWDVTEELADDYASLVFLLTHPVWDVTYRRI